MCMINTDIIHIATAINIRSFVNDASPDLAIASKLKGNHI